MICSDLGIKNGVLATRLQALIDTGLLSDKYNLAAKITKDLGNFGSHEQPEGSEVHWSESQLVDEMLRVILDVLYVLPERLEIAYFRYQR